MLKDELNNVYGKEGDRQIMDNLKNYAAETVIDTDTVSNQQGVKDTPTSNQSIKRKAFQLASYIVNPNELQSSVANMLAKFGVNPKSVHSVKIISDHKSGSIDITATVRADALKESNSQNNQRVSLIGISDRNQGKFRIKREVYNGLRNVAFVDELHWQKEKIKGDNYVVLNFDAEVLLCYLYNIPYDDKFIKLSSIPLEVSRKTCKKLGYVPCAAIITFNIENNANRGFSVEQVKKYHDR